MDWTPFAVPVFTFAMGVALNHFVLKERPKVSAPPNGDDGVAHDGPRLTVNIALQNDGDCMGYITQDSWAEATLEDGARIRFKLKLERLRRGGREGVHIDPHEGPIRFSVTLDQVGTALDLGDRHGRLAITLQPSGRRWYGLRHPPILVERKF